MIKLLKYGIFKCSCDNETLLKYDENYVNFICPRCGKKYTFGEIRRKVSRKAQEEEIGDIRRLGYNLHAETETLTINPDFTPNVGKKNEKEMSEIDRIIKTHHDEEKHAKRLLDMINYGLLPEDYYEYSDD